GCRRRNGLRSAGPGFGLRHSLGGAKHDDEGDHDLHETGRCNSRHDPSLGRPRKRPSSFGRRWKHTLFHRRPAPKRRLLLAQSTTISIRTATILAARPWGQPLQAQIKHARGMPISLVRRYLADPCAAVFRRLSTVFPTAPTQNRAENQGSAVFAARGTVKKPRKPLPLCNPAGSSFRPRLSKP